MNIGITEYCNISENSFFYRTPLVAASELKSNISNANLDKIKKRPFLYFDNSHTNQTNNTEKIGFFSCIVNTNKNLRKADEEIYCFKHI